ncbi:Carrier protein, mitochondrial [Emydomyces testavorans]|uniref:Carrier protein, mitochondrial n=1 Tax=Emydomyces testavorans TaxID=2070801 RepID=A0AAF0DIA3_9EURO|nr:Carrier protein, mitochondrial [Emydomyces testavorans]
MPSSAVASSRPESAEATRNDEISIGGRQSIYHASRNSTVTTGRHTGTGGSAMAEQEQTPISTSQRMISATWGSILTSLLVTPLDVVRVRLQSQTSVYKTPTIPQSSILFKELPPNLGITACCREVFWVGDNGHFCMVGQHVPELGKTSGGVMAADCAVEETQRKTFTSTFDGLRKIARNEGPLSLWRGLSPTLLMAIPANVIYFTGYDWLRYDKKSPVARYVNDHSAAFVAGSIARVAAAAAISPIEMFRTRLQATSGTGTDHFRATLRGLHQMTQTQGYSALWRGLTLTLWRDVPFSGLYWWGYESVKNSLANMRTRTFPHASHVHPGLHSGSHEPQSNAVVFIESFTAGAISGAVSALVTTPFDVGKTRQQVFRHIADEALSNSSSTTSGSFTTSSFKLHSSSSSTTSSSVRPEQLSIPKFLLHIFREEGLAGLFRGWAARCMKVAPACAIMISSYELGKQMAGQVNERRHHLTEHGHHTDHKPQDNRARSPTQDETH